MEKFDKLANQQTNSNKISQPILEQASTGIRLLAFLIDHIIIMMIVLTPIFMMDSLLGGIQFLGIMFVAFFLYAMKDIVKGQSPGKFILGIAVRNQADMTEIPSARNLFIRNIFCFFWYMEFIVLVFSRIRIGDRLTHTNVYNIPEKPRIIFRLGAALAILVICILITLSGMTTPLTANEFTIRMEEAGFTVEDIGYQFTEDDGVISALAVRTEYFDVLFAVFYTQSGARIKYNTNQRNLEELSRGIASSTTFVSIMNYRKFTKTFAGQYFVLSRIDNTLIVANTTLEYRAALDDILRVLGY